MFDKFKKGWEVVVLDKAPQPGQRINCNNPEKVKIVAPDPEPDLATKPPDIVGYCFGFACIDKHVDNCLEEINSETFGLVKMCQVCGKTAKLCKVKRTAEARWIQTRNILDYYKLGSFRWLCRSPYDLSVLWTKYEFAGFLKLSVDKGKKKVRK